MVITADEPVPLMSGQIGRSDAVIAAPPDKSGRDCALGAGAARQNRRRRATAVITATETAVQWPTGSFMRGNRELSARSMQQISRRSAAELPDSARNPCPAILPAG